ncbi:MAG: tetratricopeptide repeat protein [Gammaproteobacteria bacterium]
MTLIGVGLVPVLVFSWVYELTPEGLKREAEVSAEESITVHTATKLNAATVMLLAVAVGIFAIDRLVLERSDPGAAQVAGPAVVEPEPSTTVPAVPAVGTPEESAAWAVGAREASVAVLPFTTRSMDEADRFFSDGVHDDLLTQLAKIGSLRVISRTSVMDYRETTKRIPDIASELGVAAVVEGAVQRSGDMVRITAQLIDAETDEHLWAESYDRELTARNLFAIQTEIATSIAGALQATLSPAEEVALQRLLTDDLKALEAYQRARWLLDGFSVEAYRSAKQELEYALERDAGFAAAWAMVARAELAYFWFGDSSDARRHKAWEAIERGRAIDPDLPELDMAEGYYHYWGFLDYEKALAVLEPALRAYPNDADLHKVIAWVNRRYGRFDKALEHMDRALALDPRSGTVLAGKAETLIRMGDARGAEALLVLMKERVPNDIRRHTVAGTLAFSRDRDPAQAARLWDRASDTLTYARPVAWRFYLLAGDYDSALRTAEEFSPANAATGITPAFARGMTLLARGERPAAEAALQEALVELEALGRSAAQEAFVLPNLCAAYGGLGLADKARETCSQALAEMPFDAFDQPFNRLEVATGYALAGLDDLAFDMLAGAVTGPVGLGRYMLEVQPGLKALHDDPRWDELIAEARP